GSSKLLRDFAARDPRIRLVSRPNQGLTKSLNEALGLASAELIARMDADDVSMPERFERQVAFLHEHPEVVCVGSRVQLIDPYGSPITTTDHKLDHESIEADCLKGI